MSNFKERYRKFIFDVMGEGFLKDPKNRGHVCYDDFWLLSGETYSGPYIREWQRSFTDRSASTMLNAYIFSSASRGVGTEVGAFGDFDALGDEIRKNEIMARLGAERLVEVKRARPRNDNALGLISEMVVAGWLWQKNLQHEYISDDGLPDFFLADKRIAIECKSYVNAQSLDRCIDEHCSKAKKQFNRGRQRWGENILCVVVLDLSRYRVLSGSDVPAFKDKFTGLIKRSIHRRPEIDWVMCYWDVYQPCHQRTEVERHSVWVKGMSSCPAVEPIEPLKLFLSVGSHLKVPPAVLGRNSLCHCGSGRRYKLCHGVLR